MQNNPITKIKGELFGEEVATELIIDECQQCQDGKLDQPQMVQEQKKQNNNYLLQGEQINTLSHGTANYRSEYVCLTNQLKEQIKRQYDKYQHNTWFCFGRNETREENHSHLDRWMLLCDGIQHFIAQ